MGDYLAAGALPVWYDKSGGVHYEVPEVLTRLSLAERMLIQRVAPLVPLHHIKKGTMGLQGHTCAFPQDIDEFFDTLPRLPKSVSVIRIMKMIKEEVGSKNGIQKPFLVRRKYVLDALYFLKEHNSEYTNIKIDSSHLNWLGEEDEGVLDTHVQYVEDLSTNEDLNANDDLGPAIRQAIIPRLNGEDVVATGVLVEDERPVLSDNDKQINSVLQPLVREKTDKVTVNWPTTSSDPVNEFNSRGKLFVQAFPWLFPGGLGDIKDYPTTSIANWGAHLLMYEDGRFAKDEFFCFYAMNYIVRHLNASSGQFFLSDFHWNIPSTLPELKQRIQKGDTSFVNYLTFYSKRITGSNPYWLTKKAELYTWLNFHAAKKHGAPTYFITLSCAEYYWPDVVDLLKQRHKIAGLDASHIYVGSPKLIQVVNDYSIVIQEYFQKRFEIWMETVGKTIFGIKHYWARYEFAPGRGQIHVHLLAISSDQDIVYRLAYEEARSDGDTARSNRLADWAERRFGLSAMVHDGFEDINPNDKSNSPISMRFRNVTDKTKDVENLKKYVACHDCSDFCMKKSKSG